MKYGNKKKRTNAETCRWMLAQADAFMRENPNEPDPLDIGGHGAQVRAYLAQANDKTFDDGLLNTILNRNLIATRKGA